MKKYSLFFLLSIAMVSHAQVQQVIRLYPGKAPGSEKWTWHEQATEVYGTKIIYNVAEPTLTVYPALGTVNTGTSVIVAPGGGLFYLAIGYEGNEVAEWLRKKGVTVFVLKYRLVHTSDPAKEFMAAFGSPQKLDSLTHPIIPLAMEDGLAAVAYVRKNASLYKINPGRIGFMGFSAGGGVAMSVAYNSTDESRPNFIAPMYAWDKDIIGGPVPKEKMPAFIAVASDDIFRLVPVSVDIYNKWLAARQPVQLIIYQNGDHGFGMKKQGTLSDTWTARFEEWLEANGLLLPSK